jgi:2'-5' RNA ligase
MRLFFALWPPRAAATALHAWAKTVGQGKVSRTETIHLTLAFLGDVEERFLPLLLEYKSKERKHSLPIEQARYWKHNQIVWVGPRQIPEGLSGIVFDLKAFLDESKFETEKRPFAAHVTLIRKARDPGELPGLPAVEWPVDEVVLVRSHLSSKGASYEVMHRYPLG